MKLPRRTRRRSATARTDAPNGRAPERTRATTPRVVGMRKDAPAHVIDLSTDAFRTSFPEIAQRMDDRNTGHQRRRTAERAVRPPSAPGEETNDT